MKVRAAHWVVGCVAAGSVAMLAGGLVLAYLDRHAVPAALVSWDFQDVLYQVVLMPLPVVGYVLATRRPDNRIGWLFLVAGLALGLQGLAQQYGLYALVAAHGSWPAGRAVLWLYNSSLMVPLALLASVFLLFPTGRLRSRRWRPAGWLVAGTFTLGTAGMLVVATAHWRDPFFTATQAGSSRALGVVLGLTLVALAVSAAALVARFVLARDRKSTRLNSSHYTLSRMPSSA